MADEKAKRSGGNQSASESIGRPLTQDASTIAQRRRIAMVQGCLDALTIIRLQELERRLVRRSIDRFLAASNPHK